MSQKNLLAIYKLFDLWAQDFTFACKDGCSACCTQSVSMTTLEGELIFNFMRSDRPELLKKIRNLPDDCMTPLTTNEFAAACLDEKFFPEPEDTWNMTPCCFLEKSP